MLVVGGIEEAAVVVADSVEKGKAVGSVAMIVKSMVAILQNRQARRFEELVARHCRPSCHDSRHNLRQQ